MFVVLQIESHWDVPDDVSVHSIHATEESANRTADFLNRTFKNCFSFRIEGPFTLDNLNDL